MRADELHHAGRRRDDEHDDDDHDPDDQLIHADELDNLDGLGLHDINLNLNFTLTQGLGLVLEHDHELVEHYAGPDRLEPE